MRLTPRGIALLAGGTAGVALGLALGAVAAGAGGLLLLSAVAFAALRARAPGLEATRTLSAPGEREGVPVDVVLTVRNRGATVRASVRDLVPGTLHVEGSSRIETWLRARDELVLRYRVEALIPGTFELGPVHVRYRDGAGLIEHEAEVPARSRFKAHPRARELKGSVFWARLLRPLAGRHLAGQPGLGSEFFALRDFQQGDAMRDVNWRASARSAGPLVVNQREHESHARVTLLVDGRALAGVGTRGANAWVQSMRGAASLLAFSLRRRDRPRLLVYGYGTGTPRDAPAGDPHAIALLDAMVEHAPRGDASVLEAARRLAPTLPARSPVVLVSHFLDDPAAAEAVRLLRGLDQRVTVVALDPAEYLALAGASEARIAGARAENERLLRDFRASGAHVVPWGHDEDLALAVLRQEVAA